MYSVWRTSHHRKRGARAPRGRLRIMLHSTPAQAFHHLQPIFGDSTFINDTIRREHSPPVSYE